MKKAFLFFALLFAPALFAQSAPAPQTFSLTAQPIALPGGNQTVSGTVNGMTLQITQNLNLREDNVLSPAANLQGFFGGFDYHLPFLSKKLNNASPTLNGMQFDFYVSASAGVDRLTLPAPAITKQHYAFLAGGGMNYFLSSSGRWSFGAEVRYAKLPGYANNTIIISVGPAIHF